MGTSFDVLKLSENLGVRVSSLYALSNGSDKHYSKKTIVGKSGKERTLRVPDRFLMSVQKKLLENYLYYLPVSRFARAYIRGMSLSDNAAEHVGKKKVLKLDIESFFDSIEFEDVYNALKCAGLDKAATGLISALCTYHGVLPQGAPTSPYLANLVMNEFDEKMGKWCEKRGISYTRYCDDMTFSGDFDSFSVQRKAEKLLYSYVFSLNRKKTKIQNCGKRQSVTGITVNEKQNIPSEKRKKIRQEIYYLKKFGFDEKFVSKSTKKSKEEYLRSLLGQISFSLSVNPDDAHMKEYFVYVKGLVSGL